MYKRLAFAATFSVCLATPAFADQLIDEYFSSMQFVVDTANQLGEPCVDSLAGDSGESTPQCRSFEQAYAIVLDESDRLNQGMRDAQRGLPANDPRLAKLQADTDRLNGYMDEYHRYLGD
ncbi:hypothetical protein [Halotalea alkalilenta]|uniref:Uncharacterized protein n=1 Tax=Halotalea alkalilenta TaxID=376489 RepID=A0A172YHA1_9GAMM|nr:hypothetical protein [Halotalea alkalilenta]ANF58345.1 hypothetical protein A5892_13405 [Halotalea alkalilenta]